MSNKDRKLRISKGKKKTVLVQLELSEAVSDCEAAAYVRSAVDAWGGQYETHDPFFNVSNVKVKVI